MNTDGLASSKVAVVNLLLLRKIYAKDWGFSVDKVSWLRSGHFVLRKYLQTPYETRAFVYLPLYYVEGWIVFVLVDDVARNGICSKVRDLMSDQVGALRPELQAETYASESIRRYEIGAFVDHPQEAEAQFIVFATTPRFSNYKHIGLTSFLQKRKQPFQRELECQIVWVTCPIAVPVFVPLFTDERRDQPVIVIRHDAVDSLIKRLSFGWIGEEAEFALRPADVPRVQDNPLMSEVVELELTDRGDDLSHVSS